MQCSHKGADFLPSSAICKAEERKKREQLQVPSVLHLHMGVGEGGSPFLGLKGVPYILVDTHVSLGTGIKRRVWTPASQCGNDWPG